MNKKQRNTIKKIRALALKIDHDMAFGGKSKGNRHLERVVKIASFLGHKMQADPFITKAGALLHDTALPSGNDYNYKKNKEIVTGLLGSFELSRDELERVAECVASHEGTAKIRTLESKIVHDADVLEKTGILGIIRHTWKMTNSGKINPLKISKRDIQNVIDHIEWRRKKLQTPLAKKIARYTTTPIKMSKLSTIIPAISVLAQKGVITEKIARIIDKDLNKIQSEKLKEQLSLAYLTKIP
jgi:HD superfamily phosphodiesterase